MSSDVEKERQMMGLPPLEEIAQPDGQSLHQKPTATDKPLLSSLLQGELGLAKTFWQFGVIPHCIFVLINSAAGGAQSSVGLAFVNLAISAYQFVVLLGTWRAAKKYTGSKVVAYLAKFCVLVFLISLSITTFLLLDSLKRMAMGSDAILFYQ